MKSPRLHTIPFDGFSYALASRHGSPSHSPNLHIFIPTIDPFRKRRSSAVHAIRSKAGHYPCALLPQDRLSNSYRQPGARNRLARSEQNRTRQVIDHNYKKAIAVLHTRDAAKAETMWNPNISLSLSLFLSFLSKRASTH